MMTTDETERRLFNMSLEVAEAIYKLEKLGEEIAAERRNNEAKKRKEYPQRFYQITVRYLSTTGPGTSYYTYQIAAAGLNIKPGNVVYNSSTRAYAVVIRAASFNGALEHKTDSQISLYKGTIPTKFLDTLRDYLTSVEWELNLFRALLYPETPF